MRSKSDFEINLAFILALIIIGTGVVIIKHLPQIVDWFLTFPAK